MGVHHNDWRGPNLEGLALNLDDLRPLPTDLTANNRHGFYSSVQEQMVINSRVDLMPVTDIYHPQGRLGRNTLLLHLQEIAASENRHHVLGESRVETMLERNISRTSRSGFVGSENNRFRGDLMSNVVTGERIHRALPGIAGSELNHVGAQSVEDPWKLERNVLVPGITGPESRGDLGHLKNVKVKVEKVDPVETTTFSLLLRTMALPTDLTPLETEDIKSSPISLPTDVLLSECEGVKLSPEPAALPLTIDLSDTDSEGSAPYLSNKRNSYESRKPDAEDGEGIGMEDGGSCWNRGGRIYEIMDSDEERRTQDSFDRHFTRPTSESPKSSESLKSKTDECIILNHWTPTSMPMKRKCSVIDLDSIIDLEEQGLEFQNKPSSLESRQRVATRGYSANEALAKKLEPEGEISGLSKQQFGNTASSLVPQLPDGKRESHVQLPGPIAESHLISHHTEDLERISDQQYVYDMARDMDDATMEELIRDDEEDLEPDFMFEENGDVDQSFVVSSFDADCDPLIPNSKDDEEDVPSWYRPQARGNEGPIGRPSSVNTQHFYNLVIGSCNGPEHGSDSGILLLKEPSSLGDSNQQLASPRGSLGQLVSKGGDHNLQLVQVEGAVSNVCDVGVPLSSDTTDALEVLRRFVQASSERGAFQPHHVASASISPEITRAQGAPLQQGVASPAQKSLVDIVAPTVVQRIIVAENEAVSVLPHGTNVPVPKSEPVERELHRASSTDPVVPVKTEWPESTAMRPVLDSRESIINALKLFEQGRMQMLQEQINADPNGKRVRADLKVACSMRKNGMWQNEYRPIGECPGVKVGDCFTYRIEMAIIGLHRAVQAGIAVVPAHYSPYGRPVAGSVVIGVHDTYKDDKDMGETVVYSGQGGLAADKSGIYQDQKLVRGNLGLANSLELALPVRLIRGHKLQGTSTGILYSYDGLYKVTNMAYGEGVHKNMVYTFHLQRIPGQAPIHPPSVAALVYPATMLLYPVPLNSHACLPTSSQIPHNRQQACIEQATSSEGGTNQPSTSQAFQYRNEAWTGQCSNSSNVSTHQNESQVRTEEYEEKPTLYLLPRSSSQQ